MPHAQKLLSYGFCRKPDDRAASLSAWKTLRGQWSWPPKRAKQFQAQLQIPHVVRDLYGLRNNCEADRWLLVANLKKAGEKELTILAKTFPTAVFLRTRFC